MKLHVLTAITRYGNLGEIAASLIRSHWKGVELVWHWRVDYDRTAVGGQALKNAMLDEIADGWVWILDDDNLVHPGFCQALITTLAACPAARMLVGAQHTAGGVRAIGRHMLRASLVDAAQVIVRRDAIGDRRIPEHYCGDGEWIEAIARSLGSHEIAYLPGVVIHYNALRGGVA
ncbi:MAG TPA: hypothetical protein VFT99_10010 [Roseiflexaceae bacterium]|nr:hypothetical protein [Roseiflexaceae bacterium]